MLMPTGQTEKTETFTEGSRDALWIRQLLQEINSMTADCNPTQEAATKIFADNQAAVERARSEGITARTKHFEIRLQHSRDLQKKGHHQLYLHQIRRQHSRCAN